MTRKKLWIVAVGALTFLLAAGLAVISLVSAEDPQVNWLSGPPTFAEEHTYETAPPVNKDCEETTIQVARSHTHAPFEQRCLVPTAMGMVQQIYYDQSVIQPQGYAKAYPIRFVAGGNPIIDPVPGQASGVWHIGWSQGPGTLLGYYRQLSNVMKLKVGATNMYYEIDAASTPDYIFKYADGSVVPFSVISRTFSKNGRYMAIDGLGAGFVRINLMNLKVKPVAPPAIVVNGANLLSTTAAIDNTGRYVVVVYRTSSGWDEHSFKLVDLDSCGSEYDYNTIPRQKTYDCGSVDMPSPLRQLLPGAIIKSIYNVRFVNERTFTFDVQYTDNAGTWEYANYSVTAAGQTVRLKDYLALGDSYISGEGAYSYRQGTDTQRNRCHQSLVSYPYLLGAGQDSFASLACSGARMKHVRNEKKTNADDNERYDQLIGDDHPTQDEVNHAVPNRLPGVLPQKDFVDEDNPEAITISLGGNDIGFGQILERCVHPLKNREDNWESGFTCYNTYEERAEIIETINNQFGRWRSLYEGLLKSGTGERRVYVVGYPQVAKVGGNCGLNVQMNSSEIAFAHDLIAYLNSVLKKAAGEAGVFYVDTEHAFDGHRLCEASAGQAAMNGFTVDRSATGGFDFKASFHPNQRGHEMLAATVAAQTSNLTAPMPVPKPRAAQPLLDPGLPMLEAATKTSRALRIVRVVDNLTDKVLKRLSPLDFVLDASEFMTKPGARYDLVINSEPVNLGNFTADAAGNVTVSSMIPADMPPGFHTLHVYGVDIFGNPIDIQQTVFVLADVNDGDGDGVADEADSCPLTLPSGADTDMDGIDDACDPLIGVPPVGPGGGSGGQEPEGIIWRENAVLPITIEATTGGP